MTERPYTTLRRAHLNAVIWIELLPKEAQIDAKMALEKLVDTAEREIDRAFFEGQDFNRNCRRAEEFAEAKA